MLSKSFRGIFPFFIAVSLLSLSFLRVHAGTKTPPGRAYLNAATGTLYEQPVDPHGKILLSAWLDPDGSDFDEYVWDSFTIQTNETITEIDWYGVYDPAKLNKGGPVVDFRIRIFPSIPGGTEPAVSGKPLLDYQTNGNAGETVVGTAGGAPLYAYAFTLPTSFAASAGVKYWLQIEAYQHGSVPDWCWAAGSGGNNSHFWYGNLGGMFKYLTLSGDAAFTLLGPVPDTATPTDTPTDPATSTATDTATVTATATNTLTATSTNTLTSTSTSTATNTPTNTTTSTPTNTSTSTATNTATSTHTATNTPTNTPTNTVTNTATYTPTNTPTRTPTPLANTPGKVTGGGNFALSKGKATFGFVVQYSAGSANPSGSLVFMDHTKKLTLKSTSFTLLHIDGSHAWITGVATVNNMPGVPFILDIHDGGKSGADTLVIQIPTMNNYSFGGKISKGEIRISIP